MPVQKYQGVGYQKDDGGNLFATINSAIAKSLKPQKKRKTNGGTSPFEKVGAFSTNSDLTSVQVVYDLPSPNWSQVFVFYWGGPYMPIWRTYSWPQYKQIGTGAGIGNPGTIDLSGIWQTQFGKLPTDPGYLQLAFTLWGYWTPANQVIQASGQLATIVGVNGAPPYKKG